MDNAIFPRFSSYSYTNTGYNEVFTETPSPISSNSVFNDSSLCFLGDFSSGHAHFDLLNTMTTQSSRSIPISGSTSNSQGETQLKYTPVEEDIFCPWTSNYVLQSNNVTQNIQNTRKRSPEVGTSSLINSESKDGERKRSTRFQGKLPKTQKKKEPTVRRRSQKLTDKITALQKLVSPYGKTDTASVLLEASITIKALQDQIEDMLHMVSGEQTTNMIGDKRSDLERRGLCLVPSIILEELDR